MKEHLLKHRRFPIAVNRGLRNRGYYFLRVPADSHTTFTVSRLLNRNAHSDGVPSDESEKRHDGTRTLLRSPPSVRR